MHKVQSFKLLTVVLGENKHFYSYRRSIKAQNPNIVYFNIVYKIPVLFFTSCNFENQEGLVVDIQNACTIIKFVTWATPRRDSNSTILHAF